MTPIQAITSDYSDKKVLIMGLGIQGRGLGTAQFFSSIGSQVSITDLKSKKDLAPSLHKLKDYNIHNYTLGGHQKKDIENADVIIRNASVPWDHDLLRLARRIRVPIKMDSALFFEYANPTNSIGVTGTRGKTTTTTLIHQILQHSGTNVILGGNNTPRASLELLKDFDDRNTYLFELSSWQLQAFAQEKISPHIALVTNIHPDHLLDRTMAQYINDKLAITIHQSDTDHLILNRKSIDAKTFLNRSVAKTHWFSSRDIPSSWQLKTPGTHNLENAAAALAVSRLFSLSLNDAKDSIENFGGVEFRLQHLGKIANVNIINDTTSTTPIATIKAINTFPDSIVIVGGSTKKLPLHGLAKSLNSKTKATILLAGSGTNELKPLLNPKLVHTTESLSQSLRHALEAAKKGDTILFSPGFTSFGSFDNEFDRGRQFNKLVYSHKYFQKSQ